MILSSRFQDALNFAVELHAGHTGKGTCIPDISHLLAVSNLAIQHGENEGEAIAALLHDAIEDQGDEETREAIRRRFGDRVVEIVEGCTDTDATPKPPWRPQKEAYLATCGPPPSVLLISAAAKLQNARMILADYCVIGESLWKRFNGGREGTLRYYFSLATAFQEAAMAPSPLVDGLNRVVSEIERLGSSGRACHSWRRPPPSEGLARHSTS